LSSLKFIQKFDDSDDVTKHLRERTFEQFCSDPLGTEYRQQLALEAKKDEIYFKSFKLVDPVEGDDNETGPLSPKSIDEYASAWQKQESEFER
jgi:hypothetical protein